MKAQICGTPGLDGPENIAASINSYFPPAANATLTAGAKTILLNAVPETDMYGNNFGLKPIELGDLLLIIQMQDASINYTNDAYYGSNNATAGPDRLGGTGVTSLGNTGKFEYVLATNAVPLNGGTLTFKGAGTGDGVVNTYVNAAASSIQGKKSFQIVRVPQYSNLVLSSNISTPPFNGQAGGIIAFDVSGSMDFNGFTINASSKGFRGGFGLTAPSDNNISSLYVTTSADTRSVGKGEGIAGTPRYMWDGFNQVDNPDEGLPGGSYGKGAPGNAGGGGNDHNSGGGGGANGGAGGVGGDGTGFVSTGPGSFPNGGRPGSPVYDGSPENLTRLVMGGGGGGGDANNALTGVKGGVGGGIILINAGTIKGSGVVLANGGDGAPGVSGIFPDGAGGGGAGGTVFIKISNPDPAAVLRIEANGGNGGNTVGDYEPGNEHGPGGGGGGGAIFYTVNSGTVQESNQAGFAGKSRSGNGTNHNATDGTGGTVRSFILSDLPAYLQGGGSGCYARLSTDVALQNPSNNKYPGSTVVYKVTIKNATGGGNAGGVEVHVKIPVVLSLLSAVVTYTGDAGGPLTVTNRGTVDEPYFGNFNISPGDAVVLTLSLQLACNIPVGTYHVSAQALSLDPSRTFRDPQRKITAVVNAFTGAKTTYETGSEGAVPGSNYNGDLPAANADNLKVIAATPLANNNIIKGTVPSAYCISVDPAIIQGSVPTGGSEVYEFTWQSSYNNVDFTDIPAANGQTFDPPLVDTTIYFRRTVSSLSCDPPLVSNIVRFIIDAKPEVSFQLPSICVKDGAARFINETTIKRGTLQYQWTFGENSTPANATEKSPAHVYAGAGNYPVSLLAISGSCSTTVTKIFTLNGSVPRAKFTIANVPLCSSNAVEFVDNATVDFGEITSIEWFFADGGPTPAVTDTNPAKRSA